MIDLNAKQAWAEALGVSLAAIELYLSSDVIDLHIDTFIWQRLFGYQLRREHGRGPLFGHFLGHADLPRVRRAELSGAQWVITTNPLRTRRGKRDAFFENLDELTRTLSLDEGVRVVRNLAEYRAAREAGCHAAFIAVQGGNALEHDLDDFDRIPDDVLLRVTLMHFTRSRIGAPALPRMLRSGDQRLSTFGAEYVRRLNEKRIFVDLAHISREGFFGAVEAHDASQPLIVTHAGCDAVYPHFRNVTDEQLRAVADTGGVIGVMFQRGFLGPGRPKAERIVDHLAHIVDTVGPDHAALGSDFDGAIVPPQDLPSVLELPRLVQLMLERGFGEDVIVKILGENFLRALGMLRG